MAARPPDLVLHRVVLEVDAAVLVASEQHQADLIREFQLIALSRSDDEMAQLPGRLADLIVETLADYSDVQSNNLELAHQALRRGEQTVRLEMDLPVEVIPAVEKICGALEEADTYCRAGRSLLTLAARPDIATTRRWFVEEISRQIAASVAAAEGRAGAG